VIEPLPELLPAAVLRRVDDRANSTEVVAPTRPVSRGGPVRGLHLVVGDAVTVAGLSLVVSTVGWRSAGQAPPPSATTTAVVAVSFVAALAVSGAYRGRQNGLASRPGGGAGLLHGLPLGVLLALLVTRAPVPLQIEDLDLIKGVLVGLLCVSALPAVRLALTSVGTPRHVRRVVVLGSGDVAWRVMGRLQRSGRVIVVGLVDDDVSPSSPILGTEAELADICARHQVDDVVVAHSGTPAQQTLEVLRSLDERISIWVVPRLHELLSWRSTVADLQGIPLLAVAPAQAGRVARVAKRMLDVVIAGALLVLFAPVFAAVALAIRMTSPGPVLFRQLRTGRHGRLFRIYKFRTMCVDAEQQRAALADSNEVDGPLFKIRNDPRVTRVGMFLRQTSLDELPQLINVFRGEMSLVGPRPFPVEESAKITGWATLRFSVRPGMTGLWQVCGRNALGYDDLRHLDYLYAASWSLMWDLRILLQTPGCVLHRRGVI
jgi:exopolysaccharide biosynthesis polyprenyl glycosylphosphotransferase